MSPPKAQSKPWVTWGVAALFYLYELILRVSPSVMTSDLMVAFDATSSALGILISSYYYSYTAMQLPCGVVLDRLGPRNLLSISAILCIIGSVLFASLTRIGSAQIGRFLVGAGSACAFASCLQIASQSFAKKHFAMIVSLTNIMGILGSLLGGLPVAKLANALGWREATYVLAGVGLVIVLLILVFIPKNVAHKARPTKGSTKKSLASLFRNKQILIAGAVAGLMYLPISVFAELWVIPFFMAKHVLDNEGASIASAVMFVGIVIGSIVMAVVARKIRSYVLTIRVASLAVALLFLSLAYWSCSLFQSLALVFAIGFFTGAQVLGFTCAKNNSSPALSGTTVAFTNCIVMLLGAIFQPLFGVLLDFFWTGAVSESGVRVYDAPCYRSAIAVIPAFLAVSHVLTFFMKETIHAEDE
jgi:predicted MFS family arabinose efflux permease